MVLGRRLAQDARHGAIPRRSELQRGHEEARAAAALVSVRELCRGTPLLGSTQLLSGLWPLPLCGRDQTGSAHWAGLSTVVRTGAMARLTTRSGRLRKSPEELEGLGLSPT